MSTKKTTKKNEVVFQAVSLEEAEQQMKAEMERQLKEHWSPEKIKARVEQALDRSFNHIVAVSLGFEKDSWGRHEWKVDHCNGRAGESEIGQMISKAARQAVNDCILANIDKFSINDKLLKAMADEFNSVVTGYQGRQIIEQAAKNRLSRLAQLLDGQISGAQ